MAMTNTTKRLLPPDHKLVCSGRSYIPTALVGAALADPVASETPSCSSRKRLPIGHYKGVGSK